MAVGGGHAGAGGWGLGLDAGMYFQQYNYCTRLVIGWQGDVWADCASAGGWALNKTPYFCPRRRQVSPGCVRFRAKIFWQFCCAGYTNGLPAASTSAATPQQSFHWSSLAQVVAQFLQRFFAAQMWPRITPCSVGLANPRTRSKVM